MVQTFLVEEITVKALHFRVISVVTVGTYRWVLLLGRLWIFGGRSGAYFTMNFAFNREFTVPLNIFCSKWNPDKSSSDDGFFSRVTQKNTIFLSFLKWNFNMVFIRYKICWTTLYWGFHWDWIERISGCFLWIAFLRMLIICVSNFIFIRVNCVWLIIIIWLIH